MECPKCQKELRRLMIVLVDASADSIHVTKNLFRDTDVKIYGVDWGQSSIYCPNCRWNMEALDKYSKNVLKIRFLSRSLTQDELKEVIKMLNDCVV